jgi:VIT1/CCC1 family predicted Fe2+/Mn2+ transporter
MVWHSVRTGLWISSGVTPLALFVFGLIKGRFTGVSAIKSALQTAFIGGLAAAAAFVIARLIS